MAESPKAQAGGQGHTFTLGQAATQPKRVSERGSCLLSLMRGCGLEHATRSSGSEGRGGEKFNLMALPGGGKGEGKKGTCYAKFTSFLQPPLRASLALSEQVCRGGIQASSHDSSSHSGGLEVECASAGDAGMLAQVQLVRNANLPALLGAHKARQSND